MCAGWVSSELAYARRRPTAARIYTASATYIHAHAPFSHRPRGYASQPALLFFPSFLPSFLLAWWCVRADLYAIERGLECGSGRSVVHVAADHVHGHGTLALLLLPISARKLTTRDNHSNDAYAFHSRNGVKHGKSKQSPIIGLGREKTPPNHRTKLSQRSLPRCLLRRSAARGSSTWATS